VEGVVEYVIIELDSFTSPIEIAEKETTILK
jgi:hypothetical protein